MSGGRKIITDDPALKAILAARARKSVPASLKTKDVSNMATRSATTERTIGGPAALPAFTNFGDFARAVAKAATATGEVDRRLVRAPTGSGELTQPGGGFLVPTTLLDGGPIESIFADSVLMKEVDYRETDKPIADARIPGVDETSRATGSRNGGVVSFWLPEEGNAITPSVSKTRNIAFAAHKLVVAIIASAELVSDAPLLESHLREVIKSEFGYQADAAILSGAETAGQPMGILNSPALVSVAKQAGQATQTIVKENIDAMWSVMPGVLRRRAIWACNPDVELQLNRMTIGGEQSNLYAPAGSAGDTTPRLKGRPLFVTEANPVLGQFGDIVLFDPQSYLMLANPMKFALSMDARWNNNECVFRITYRVDGKPKWSAPISPANGGQKLSPFVALAAR